MPYCRAIPCIISIIMYVYAVNNYNQSIYKVKPIRDSRGCRHKFISRAYVRLCSRMHGYVAYSTENRT